MVHFISTFAQRCLEEVFRRYPQALPPVERIQQCKFVAHRGAHHEDAENTIAAFDQAQALGAWGIECDIRWTKDFVPVIHHDCDTTRVFGDSFLIAQCTFAELRQRFPQIPTLQELVERYGKKMHLMIELKTEARPDLSEQKRILADVLSPLEAIHDFHFLSLDLEPFDSFNHFPQATYLFVAELNVASLYRESRERGYQGLTGHYALISQREIDAFQAIGGAVGTGMVHSANCLKRELRRGVEWIFTDRMRDSARDLRTLLSSLSL